MKKAIPVLLALLVIGTGATGQLLPESHSSDDLPVLDLAAQIDQDIHTSLSKNAQAQTLLEWHKSGFTPTDVFANVHALRRPEALTALCASLSRLPSSDLSLFENEIRFAGPATRLPCALQLTQRLDQHWSQMREELARTRASFRLTAASKKGLSSGLASLKRRTSARQGAQLLNPMLRPGEVALTFDEGPHPLVTKQVLGALAEFDVRANFFEVGQNASSHPELARLITQAGHSLGSLTWKHPALVSLTIKEAELEIQRGRELVAAAGGEDSRLFRFPYGERSGPLDDYLKEQRMTPLAFSIDAQDWKLRSPRAVIDRVLSELERNRQGVVAFHDVYQQTAIALPYLLDELRMRDYTAVVFTGR